jgi:sugar lactone lactonase YvrE
MSAHHKVITAPPDTKQVVRGLNFPEGARIGPDCALYISDVYAHEVLRIDLHTWERKHVASVPGQPSGLGWLPDGRMLIVSMRDLKLLRLEHSGEVVVHADLRGATTGAINDMFVDGLGRAWIGDFGFDYYGLLEREPNADPLFGPGANPPTACVTRVDADGSVHTVADGLRFPNGIVQPSDDTLVVAETVGGCLTAFQIGEDGSLTNRRLWADLSSAGICGDPVLPDGLSLAGDGGIWVADPGNGGALCVEEGGKVRYRVQASQSCFSVVAIAPDTVLCCTAETSNSNLATAHKTGRLELATV